ncbi:uncharacterized protein TEOVI_000127700 [Trypanosoma equiperdum]|uniref:Uncharacterized protein n=1 Tax=Trypanosoma equiperdum TaxID=5694 RepID=A0A1G4IBV6_TRYEQ|nr:hypothetical protein, conserved [Trypanosoma equiperdum]
MHTLLVTTNIFALCMLSVFCSVVLFVLWTSATSRTVNSLPQELLLGLGNVDDILTAITLKDSLRNMNMANIICFALLILLVILLSLVEGVLIRMKSDLEECAKLPPVTLVQHMNNSYRAGLENSGLAYREDAKG